MKVSAEIGMQMPVLAGAGIKAMLSLLPDEEIDEILARTELERFTPHSIVDKAAYRKEILRVRAEGVAYDREEYLEGVVAFAVPVVAGGKDVQAAVWAVSLASQVSEASVPQMTGLLKRISEEIGWRLQPRAGEK
jgi:IclR family KDG regulon transcriptional repressor